MTKGAGGSILFTAYVAALLLVLVPPIWLAHVVVPRGRLPDRLVRLGVRAAMRLSGCRVRVSGLDRLTACGAAMLVSNHSSYLDSAVLMSALPIDYLFVVNHHAASWPFIGRVIRRRGHLVVDRSKHADRLACSRAMVDTLRGGRSVLVFPEGTIHANGALLPFQPGAFRAAIAAGRPVVPVVLDGTDRMLPRHRWLLRRADVDVVIHEPIASIAPGEHGRAGILRMSRSARDAMAR